MSDVTCRRATSEDYQDVIDINDADYLYTMYHKFINDPQTHSYVCEKNGEIVSLLFVIFKLDRSNCDSRLVCDAGFKHIYKYINNTYNNNTIVL